MRLVGHALPYSLLAFAGPPRPSPTRAPSVHLCASPLAEGTWEVTKSEPTGPLQLTTSSMRVMVAGKELCFESGAMARQASGAAKSFQPLYPQAPSPPPPTHLAPHPLPPTLS